MRIPKAIITAAGKGQTSLPLQRLVDIDSNEKSALEVIIEEIEAAGIESIGVVIRPPDEDAYRQAAGKYADRLKFIFQEQPSGYGQALLCSRSYVGTDPVLHLVGDHVYLSRLPGKRCAQQLVEVATSSKCAVSAVQPTRETMLPFFGAIGGNRLPQTSNLYEVKKVIEKPTPTLAEQELTVAGFRSGMYLCFFGMHVLTPTVFEILAELIEMSERPVPLAEALNVLATRERYLACEIVGSRHNIGIKYGLLSAQLALSLSGQDRDRILSELVELLAAQPSVANAS